MGAYSSGLDCSIRRLRSRKRLLDRVTLISVSLMHIHARISFIGMIVIDYRLLATGIETNIHHSQPLTENISRSCSPDFSNETLIFDIQGKCPRTFQAYLSEKKTLKVFISKVVQVCRISLSIMTLLRTQLIYPPQTGYHQGRGCYHCRLPENFIPYTSHPIHTAKESKKP